MNITTHVPLPKPPGFEKPLPAEQVSVDVYKFPEIKNFSTDGKEAK